MLGRNVNPWQLYPWQAAGARLYNSLHQRYLVPLAEKTETTLDVMLLYWVESDTSKINTRTEINLKILDAMASEGIEFSDRTMITYNKDVQY